MSQSDVYAEWQKLCDGHKQAREAYFKAFANVNQKFSGISSVVQGTKYIWGLHLGSE